MKKLILLSLIAGTLFVGCSVNQEPTYRYHTTTQNQKWIKAGFILPNYARVLKRASKYHGRRIIIHCPLSKEGKLYIIYWKELSNNDIEVAKKWRKMFKIMGLKVNSNNDLEKIVKLVKNLNIRSLQEFKDWMSIIKQLGLNLTSSELPMFIKNCKKYNLTPQTIKKWLSVQNTLTANDIIQIKQITNIKNPQEFKKWYDIVKKYAHTVNLSETLNYISDLKKLKISLTEIKKFISFNHTLTLADIITIKKLHLDINEIRKWNKIGVKNINDIFFFVRENISLSKVQKYIKYGIKDIDLIDFAISNHITPQQLATFNKYNIKDKELITFGVKNHIPAKVIVAYLKNGVESYQRLLTYYKLNISPKKVKLYEYLDIAYFSKNEIKKIVQSCPNGVNIDLDNTNPFYTKNKCYQYLGEVQQILSKNTIVISHRNRQIMLIFNKVIPSNIIVGKRIFGVIKGLGYEEKSLVTGEDVYVDKFKPIVIKLY